MTEAAWLIDKSALVRLALSPERSQWLSRINRGLVRISTPTVLEVGFSARSGPDWEALLGTPPVSAMPVEPITPTAERRAVEVQGHLARAGRHRAPSIPDLLIAAVAETSGLVVLHLDKDFEVIADLTGQRVERLSTS